MNRIAQTTLDYNLVILCKDLGYSRPLQTTPENPARQAHNLKVVGSNPTPATTIAEQPPRPPAPGAVFVCGKREEFHDIAGALGIGLLARMNGDAVDQRRQRFGCLGRDCRVVQGDPQIPHLVLQKFEERGGAEGWLRSGPGAGCPPFQDPPSRAQARTASAAALGSARLSACCAPMNRSGFAGSPNS